MKHELEVHEGSAASDVAGVEIKLDLRTYEILTPIFKRGKLWKKGAKIELDKLTGDRFVKAGEVKEVK